MIRLAPWFLAALAALAGCSKSSARPSAKMSGPQGVAAYYGYAVDQPATRRALVAVANTRGDDLRLIDAVTDQVLSAPTVVSALMVPTEPRPSLIASGSIHEVPAAGTNALVAADLLVVAPRGQVWRPGLNAFGAVIQRIVTWDPLTRVDAAGTNTLAAGNVLVDLGGTVDLGTVLPDATLTSLLVVPVPESDGKGGWRSTPGRARVLAGTSDGALVSIEVMQNDADPAAVKGIVFAVPPGSPLASPLAVQHLGFTIIDLAVSSDGTRVYAGTLDPIPGPAGVLGVAEFDNTATPGAMPVRALAARLGTTQVAAIDVKPFAATNSTDPTVDTFGPPAPRVYAVLDPTSCGHDTSMPCGIAALDPVTGTLAADPAGELPYQLPIKIPGEVVDLAVIGAPAVAESNTVQGLVKIDPGSGVRWTGAIAGVASSNGRIYLADLSHFSVGNALNPLVGASTTRVASSGFNEPSSGSAKIGIWSAPASGAPAIQYDTAAAAVMRVTPGYTPVDTFTLTYQGDLPGLTFRQAKAHVVSGGTTGAPSWVAVQQATGLTGAGTSKWRSVGRLYDPRSAIHVGDVVLFTSVPATCTGGNFEMTVTALLPPDPNLYPGGAVAVTPAATQPAGASADCLPVGDPDVTVSFKASGLVLVGTTTGYAGRPGVVTDPATATDFELRYVDERTLSCPIMPDDQHAWPPAPANVAACEANVATCRATCERLLLARRARRLFYVTDVCPATSTALGQACVDKWQPNLPGGLALPNPIGPALAFKVGTSTVSGTGLPALVRGATLYFNTASGQVPTTRSPSVGGGGIGSTSPYGVTLFDRSAATQNAADAIHGYAAFAYDLVLDFAPWAAQSTATTIR